MEKPQEEETEKEVEKEADEDISQDEWVGPLPSEATEPQAKKRKVLNHEKLFLDK